MKRKINILIGAVLILLILPMQFGCNKDKLLQTQTEDFDPWVYDFNSDGQIDADELEAILNDFAENKINEEEFKAVTDLWASHGTEQDGNSEKSSFKPCSYDSNFNGVIDIDEALEAVDDYFDDKITLEQVFEVLDMYFSGDSCFEVLAKEEGKWVLVSYKNQDSENDTEADIESYTRELAGFSIGQVTSAVVKQYLLQGNTTKWIAKGFGVVGFINTFFDLFCGGTASGIDIGVSFVRKDDGKTGYVSGIYDPVAKLSYDQDYNTSVVLIPNTQFPGYWKINYWQTKYSNGEDILIGSAVFKGDMLSLSSGEAVHLIWDNTVSPTYYDLFTLEIFKSNNGSDWSYERRLRGRATAYPGY
ncbi:MAG: hypothetical protein K8R54_16525 [Bacteroidales bacterium]|nr:hypothetical protein [Bacteroidales bacterium]